MKEKLEKIVHIQFGPYAKSQASGDIKYLLASHFDAFGTLSKFKDSYLNSNEVEADELLEEGDVILAGKGLRFFAWAYQKEKGKCIASSLFYVLKPKKELLGDYLAFYLNRDQVQHQLKLLSAGGTVPSLAKKELQQLSIEVPSLEQQQEIVSLDQLYQKQIKLYQELITHKKQIHREILNKKYQQLKETPHA
ncbi:MAG: restriction endonuclease subunit S [Vicingaceae bacterium]